MLKAPDQPDPKPQMPEEMAKIKISSKPLCKHKWVFQRTDYEKRALNYITTTYKRIDTFYCEKCLEIKEIISKEEDIVECRSFVEKPYWYKG